MIIIRSSKIKKFSEITDEMIGAADGICSCASTVSNIINSQNKGKEGKTSLKKKLNSLKKKFTNNNSCRQ